MPEILSVWDLISILDAHKIEQISYYVNCYYISMQALDTTDIIKISVIREGLLFDLGMFRSYRYGADINLGVLFKDNNTVEMVSLPSMGDIGITTIYTKPTSEFTIEIMRNFCKQTINEITA